MEFIRYAVEQSPIIANSNTEREEARERRKRNEVEIAAIDQEITVMQEKLSSIPLLLQRAQLLRDQIAVQEFLKQQMTVEVSPEHETGLRSRLCALIEEIVGNLSFLGAMARLVADIEDAKNHSRSEVVLVEDSQ